MDKDYIVEIEELAKEVSEKNPKIDLFKPRVMGRTPTQAFSEFLTNKEQGDWAEDLMLKILDNVLSGFVGVSYGRKDSLVAGEEQFKAFYEGYQKELDEIGKCPDIIVFDERDYNAQMKADYSSNKPRKELIVHTQKAKFALEVRSSAFLVKKYIEYMKKKSKITEGERGFLSFTPKVEDLAVILKWIQIHGVKHFYVQVFFDSIYVISFKRILEILSDPRNLKIKYFIEHNAKNQFKSTVHINLDEGTCITSDVSIPDHKGEVKELPRGRLLFYMRFANLRLPNNITPRILSSAFEI